MQNEKIEGVFIKKRKINKWFLIVGVIFGLIIFSFFYVSVMPHLSERRSERESTAMYLISGGRTRCADEDLVYGSKEFLSQEFKKELDCCISKRRLLKKALESKNILWKLISEEHYNNVYNGKDDYKTWVKKCSEYENKIIDIIKDLK